MNLARVFLHAFTHSGSVCGSCPKAGNRACNFRASPAKNPKKAVYRAIFRAVRCIFLFDRNPLRPHISSLKGLAEFRRSRLCDPHGSPLRHSRCGRRLKRRHRRLFLTLRHRAKHFTSCKCGICVPAAHKLCAQQDASLFQAQPNRNPAKRFLFGEEQQRSG